MNQRRKDSRREGKTKKGFDETSRNSHLFRPWFLNQKKFWADLLAHQVVVYHRPPVNDLHSRRAPHLLNYDPEGLCTPDTAILRRQSLDDIVAVAWLIHHTTCETERERQRAVGDRGRERLQCRHQRGCGICYFGNTCINSKRKEQVSAMRSHRCEMR